MKQDLLASSTSTSSRCCSAVATRSATAPPAGRTPKIFSPCFIMCYVWFLGGSVGVAHWKLDESGNIVAVERSGTVSFTRFRDNVRVCVVVCVVCACVYVCVCYICSLFIWGCVCTWLNFSGPWDARNKIRSDVVSPFLYLHLIIHFHTYPMMEQKLQRPAL